MFKISFVLIYVMNNLHPPQGWFWSHDIKVDQIQSTIIQGYQLQRLSSYGSGNSRRFANFSYRNVGSERTYVIDKTLRDLNAYLWETKTRPTAITVNLKSGHPLYSVVVEKGGKVTSTIHADLTEAALKRLVDDQHAIVDFVTYLTSAGQRYTIILETRPTQWLLFTNLSAKEIETQLRKTNSELVRLRSYVMNGQRLFTGVAQKARQASYWYADIDADSVAKKLEANHAYPVDLDAYTDEKGNLRFSAIMAPE